MTETISGPTQGSKRTEALRPSHSLVRVALVWLAGSIGFIGVTLVLAGGPLGTDDVVGAALFSFVVTVVLLRIEEIAKLTWPRRIGLILGAGMVLGLVAGTIIEVSGVRVVEVPSARVVGIALLVLGLGAHSQLQLHLLRRA